MRRLHARLSGVEPWGPVGMTHVAVRRPPRRHSGACRTGRVAPEMELWALREPPEGTAVVLSALALMGRGGEAEEFLRQLRAVGAPVFDVHCAYVIRAWGVARRPLDAERAFRALAASGAPIAHRARAELLWAFATGACPDRARKWFWGFVEAEDPLGPEAFAALVEAHARPETRDDLLALWLFFPAPVRRRPEVIESFVHAFAGAHDAETAEECLVEAMAVSTDALAVELMVAACVDAYTKDCRPDDAARLRSWAEDVGVQGSTC